MSCSCSCRWPHIPSPVPPPSVAAIPETWALYLLVYSDVHQCQNWITHHQDRSHLQCLIGRCRAPHQPWCPAQQGAALLPVQRTLMFRYLHSWIQRTTNIISERKVAIKNHTNQTVEDQLVLEPLSANIVLFSWELCSSLDPVWVIGIRVTSLHRYHYFDHNLVAT